MFFLFLPSLSMKRDYVETESWVGKYRLIMWTLVDHVNLFFMIDLFILINYMDSLPMVNHFLLVDHSLVFPVLIKKFLAIHNINDWFKLMFSWIIVNNYCFYLLDNEFTLSLNLSIMNLCPNIRDVTYILQLPNYIKLVLQLL